MSALSSAGIGRDTLKLSSSASSSTSIGQFRCKCCRRVLPVCEQCVSRPGVCIKDNASYKSIAQRWNKQRQLKIWWDSLDDDQKANWYLKQHTIGNGVKRKFDEITYAERSIQSTTAQESFVDMMIPWSIYKRNGLTEGTDLVQLEREFKALVERPDTEAVFARGQWHVPEYIGIRREHIESVAQNIEVERSALIHTPQQLELLQASGRQLLQQFGSTITPPLQVAPAGLPAVDAVPSDQPSRAQPVDVIAQFAQREAMCGSIYVDNLFYNGLLIVVRERVERTPTSTAKHAQSLSVTAKSLYSHSRKLRYGTC